MSFNHANLLWLLALVPLVLIFLIARERRRAFLARRFASERLRGVSNPARPLRPWLIALAFTTIVIALAGPRAGYTTVTVESRESNRVVVIDVSQSMAAEDIGMSRLSAAKSIARRIVEAHDGRVALIVFESRAEVVSPLTMDTEAVSTLIDTIGTGELSQPGSDIGGAVQAALRLLSADPSQKGDIIVISDGEDQGSRLPEATRAARTQGVEVSAVVVGSAEGSVIRDGNGLLRDEGGNTVTTYARADTLGALTRGTEGRLLENPFAARALDPLLSATSGDSGKKRDVRVPVDRYQWPLALAVAALLGGSLANRGAE